MKIEDRIALGCAPDSALGEVDHATLMHAKSTGPQVLAASASDVSQIDGLYRFVLSTEEVNRRGDIIRQSGLDFRNWNRNPVVLHNHDDDLPIGMGRVVREGSRTMLDVQFSQVNPRAQMVKALVDEGIIKAASVAIMPKKVGDPKNAEERQRLGLGRYGVVYEASEVIEGSIVTIPADPSAVRNALRHAHVGDDAEVERFVESMQTTEMDLARRLRAAPATVALSAEPDWLPRFEAALDRAAARIEHAVRGGARREPEGSTATAPIAAQGIDLSEFFRGLGNEVDKRIARKD